MRWEHPQYFLALVLALPMLVFFYALSFRSRKRRLKKFCDAEMFPVLLPRFSWSRQYWKASFNILGIAMLLVALCQPQWGFQWEEVKRKGVDIIVAVDVSASMLAQDIEPNRLERARRKVIDLLKIMQGDRVGLIAFAGVPFLQCPLTLDYGAIELFLGDLSPDLIPVPGTAITQAIELASNVFLKQGSQSKALILITDGEDFSGDPIAAAKAAAKQGIKIFTIGIGQEGGAPIPSREAGGGFQKDESGNVVLTKLDEETLKKIALETGGIYVRSVTGDLDLEKIYIDEIRRGMSQVELKSGRRKRWEERFQWPLSLGILCLICSSLIPEQRREKKKTETSRMKLAA